MSSKAKAEAKTDEKWVIKGMSLNIRQATTETARDEGISVGELVSRAFDNYATDPKTTFQKISIQDMDDVKHALIALETRLEHLEHNKRSPSSVASSTGTLDKITSKAHWRDWFHKGQDAVQQAFHFTRNKISSLKK